MDISKSWARDVIKSDDGDITFFAQNKQNISFENIEIVTLAGVNDNMYPPQRKSFSLIRHFHDTAIEKYDWFMRLDDDVYLNFAHLKQWLNRLDPNKLLMMGNAGLGRDKDDYVPPSMTYCMGGTGVIFSREAIRQIRPYLQECLK